MAGSSRKDFDVFVSNARADDQPPGAGSVSAIRDLILVDAADAQTGFRPLPVFCDKEDISESQQWRQRISRALRSSRILLVCASPNYCGSERCQREWFTEGRECLAREEVWAQIKRLGASVAERIVRAEQVSSASGNLLRLNPYFVG